MAEIWQGPLHGGFTGGLLVANAQGVAGLAETMPAADAAAWSLLLLLFFCLVCIAGGALLLRHRERLQMQRRPNSDAPISDGADGGAWKNHNSVGDRAPRRPWERDADWWMK